MSSKSLHFENPLLALGDGLAGLRRALVRFARFYGACLAVARQRRQLLQLDEAALQDIGVSPAQARAEAGRGFWDVSGLAASRRRNFR